MNFALVAVLALTLVASSGCALSAKPVGPVTTAEAAVVEAKSGFASVYAKTRYESFAPRTVAQFEPYTATLTNGEWHVRGTVPVGFRGVVPEAKVRSSDAFTRVEGVQVGSRE
jgi:hypothetical protein